MEPGLGKGLLFYFLRSISDIYNEINGTFFRLYSLKYCWFIFKIRSETCLKDNKNIKEEIL